jgi:hypothetical protein
MEMGQACNGIISAYFAGGKVFHGPLQHLQHSACSFMTQVYYHGGYKSAVS